MVLPLFTLTEPDHSGAKKGSNLQIQMGADPKTGKGMVCIQSHERDQCIHTAAIPEIHPAEAAEKQALGMNTSCCKGCTKRKINCHSICEEYQEFAKERRRILDAKNRNCDFESMLADSVTKSKRMKR